MWKFTIVLTPIMFILACNSKESTTLKNNNMNTLVAGNSRFAVNSPLNWEPLSSNDKKIMSENLADPWCIVLSCSDMDISPAILLDQKIGTLYQIRTVGNFISNYEFGSIEYALQKYECKNIFILGHKNCGAISYFVETIEDRLKGQSISNLDHIDTLINSFASEETFDKLSPQDKINVTTIVKKNIYFQANLIKTKDGQIKKLVEHNQVKVFGGVLDPNTRKIDFFEL